MQTKFIEQELFFYNTSERLYWVMIIQTYLQLNSSKVVKL